MGFPGSRDSWRATTSMLWLMSKENQSRKRGPLTSLWATTAFSHAVENFSMTKPPGLRKCSEPPVRLVLGRGSPAELADASVERSGVKRSSTDVYESFPAAGWPGHWCLTTKSPCSSGGGKLSQGSLRGRPDPVTWAHLREAPSSKNVFVQRMCPAEGALQV